MNDQNENKLEIPHRAQAGNDTLALPGDRLLRIEMLRRQIDAELEAEIAELKAENAELRARLEADRLMAEAAAQSVDVPQADAEPPKQEEWLTPKDVAKRLGVCVGTVYWYMNQGEPVCWPLYRMRGNKRHTKPSDLETWIESRKAKQSEAAMFRNGKRRMSEK